ncbi:TBC1 domain family member 5 homolog A-like isoform X1 [Olea europaea subsp. europaea]|uniref:TBC1 domain family member 5 homolog A-like isoform X1 n=1 Tax=Olea europaea subsp. europaea TaxID=158383 RepID=A0A8S0SKU7_OLEEU|nr:TBC1 domain family member 5 homolog A-like isoform X1 [Olea europaea subsp. europaea]
MSISPVPMEATMPETASCSEGPRRFGYLRGVQWRIDLGILPSSPSSSIDDLRLVAANSRRRYAALRRQLLIDPQVLKNGSCSPDVVMDNPLSQNPDSMWGRFFRNAELERMVDQDLTRLYPEHGSYFQTPGCQGMLRRILLLWCLRHPVYGYRQGMHELLAPLLYVLHIDLELLSEVRKVYEDHFTDIIDGFSFHENDWTHKFDFKKLPEYMEDCNGSESPVKINSLGELEPKIQTIVLLSDAYGTEGELGVVLSEKFLEHDAHCMFDALMNGTGGAVAMAEFFSPSPFGGSHTMFPPIIESSAALYHLLSIIDSSLHSHLVELGVEPQYFALRWLRVLFGREFALEDLLVIWDEIFAYENTKFNKPGTNDAESNVGVLNSSRGALIAAFAVSMILQLRSSLLATENATSCLQRLLNFPVDVDLLKLLAKAKSLQALAVEAINSTPLLILPRLHGRRNAGFTKAHIPSLDLTSPRTTLNMAHESYWEERWRVLHMEEERKQGSAASAEKQVPNRKKGWSERVRLRLSRTKCDPFRSKATFRKKNETDEGRKNIGGDVDFGHKIPAEVEEQDVKDTNFSTSETRCSSGCPGNEENSSNISDLSTPVRGTNDYVNMSGRSSVASNFSAEENDTDSVNFEPLQANPESSPLPVSELDPDDDTLNSTQNYHSVIKQAAGIKERKLLSDKFQLFWKFGRNINEGTSDRAAVSEDAIACDSGSDCNNVAGSSIVNGCNSTSGISKAEIIDQNLIFSLSDLGQSMLENIQVIESVFQQDPDQMGSLENCKNAIVGEGHITAMAALEELRKISNLLSEM